MNDLERLAEIVLEALEASDGGNNPFYGDDADTVSLARQIAESIVASGWPGDER